MQWGADHCNPGLKEGHKINNEEKMGFHSKKIPRNGVRMAKDGVGTELLGKKKHRGHNLKELEGCGGEGKKVNWPLGKICFGVNRGEEGQKRGGWGKAGCKRTPMEGGCHGGGKSGE